MTQHFADGEWWLDMTEEQESEAQSMTRKPLTQEQAIEFYTELSRRVQVGAYLELEHDGSFPPDDGTPESTTLESLHNLEEWAAGDGREFIWHKESNSYTLEPMSEETRHARAQAQAYQEDQRLNDGWSDKLAERGY